MSKKYFLISVALLASLFIYVFYRTDKTFVNEIIIHMISLETFTNLKANMVRAIPLNNIVIYSLPEGLWIFCITLTSKPYYLKLGNWRIDCLHIPLIFCVGLEIMQLFHITNGRFDFMDIGVSVIFWLLGIYALRDKGEKQNVFTKLNAKTVFVSAAIALYIWRTFLNKSNKPHNMNRIKKHLASYKYSIRGIALAFRYEHNMVVHLAAAIAVVATNCLLKINKTEWLITFVLIGLAWMAEIFNTAIEKLADRVTKEQDPLIGQAKDLASGAVLVICGFAVVCAGVIYWPYLYGLYA